MEKNIIITMENSDDKSFELAQLARNLILWMRLLMEWLSMPVRILSGYYSSVLGREVSIKQTWALIEVQTAFFAGIFPADISVFVRLLMAAWFLYALGRCKKMF